MNHNTHPQNTEPLPAEQAPLRHTLLQEHTSDPYLREHELTAIVGSRIEAGAKDFEADYAVGGVSDAEYQSAKKVSARALEIVDTSDPEISLLESATEQLENVSQQMQLQQGNSIAERFNKKRLTNSKEALEVILAVYRNVSVDGPNLAAMHKTGRERTDAFREYTNQVIREHNQTIETPQQSTTDIPQEMPTTIEVSPSTTQDEAARAAAKQEEITAARKRLDELFANNRRGRQSSEKNRTSPEGNETKILQDVLVASRGTTIVHTDMPPHDDNHLKRGGQQDSSIRSGFGTLGDRKGSQFSTQEVSSRSNRFKIPSDKVDMESLFFKQLKEPVYETRRTETQTGMFSRKTTVSEQRIQTGERQVSMINPLSGHEEPAVEVVYQFTSDPITYHSPTGEPIRYATTSGRGGNMLVVNVRLPKSVADALGAAAKEDPELVRRFAKDVVVSDRTGITEHDWSVGNTDKGKDFKVSPPYEQLPAGWTLAVYDEDQKTEAKVPVR